jgi:hypothetical protein
MGITASAFPVVATNARAPVRPGSIPQITIIVLGKHDLHAERLRPAPKIERVGPADLDLPLGDESLRDADAVLEFGGCDADDLTTLSELADEPGPPIVAVEIGATTSHRDSSV